MHFDFVLGLGATKTRSFPFLGQPGDDKRVRAGRFGRTGTRTCSRLARALPPRFPRRPTTRFPGKTIWLFAARNFHRDPFRSLRRVRATGALLLRRARVYRVTRGYFLDPCDRSRVLKIDENINFALFTRYYLNRRRAYPKS